MVRVYFDLETTGLDPNSQIIAIGYKHLGKKAEILASWESSEAEIISRFLDHASDLIGTKFLELVGFNILRFDIPMLILRGIRNGIQPSKLFKLVYEGYTIDLHQVLLGFNNFEFKGLSQFNLGIKLGIPVPEISSDQIPEYYSRGDYQSIVQKLERDLDFLERLDGVLRQRCFLKGILRL